MTTVDEIELRSANVYIDIKDFINSAGISRFEQVVILENILFEFQMELYKDKIMKGMV